MSWRLLRPLFPTPSAGRAAELRESWRWGSPLQPGTCWCRAAAALLGRAAGVQSLPGPVAKHPGVEPAVCLWFCPDLLQQSRVLWKPGNSSPCCCLLVCARCTMLCQRVLSTRGKTLPFGAA